ncbi:hypothetical protein GGI20_006354, partial [Coemansia sp. BCRC 34301]
MRGAGRAPGGSQFVPVTIYPYMNLSNLSGSDADWTSVDDWESILYALCQYAMIGIEEETR